MMLQLCSGGGGEAKTCGHRIPHLLQKYNVKKAYFYTCTFLTLPVSIGRDQWIFQRREK